MLIPIPDQTATIVAKALYEHVFTTYALPAILLLDHDTNFLSRVVTELCTLFKVNKKFTLAYRPQFNSLIETKNSIVYKCLRIYCKNNMSGTHSYQEFSSPTMQQMWPQLDNFHNTSLCSAKSALLSSIITSSHT